MQAVVPASKCDLLMMTEDGEIFVEGVEQSHIDALRAVADEESKSGRSNWASRWLASVAKGASAGAVYDLALTYLDQLDGAIDRGLEQAEAICGHPAVNRPDAVAYAYEAVRVWLNAYLGWYDKKSLVVPASRSKIRIRNGPSVANVIKRELLREAVESLRRRHPDWRVQGAEVVRLNPRKSSLTSTGVATFVKFDGHDKVAIVWEIEPAPHQQPPASNLSSAS